MIRAIITLGLCGTDSLGAYIRWPSWHHPYQISFTYSAYPGAHVNSWYMTRSDPYAHVIVEPHARVVIADASVPRVKVRQVDAGRLCNVVKCVARDEIT